MAWFHPHVADSATFLDLFRKSNCRTRRVSVATHLADHNFREPICLVMPIFSRRRIQQMLDDLSGTASPSHFIGRLNDKRFENALPADAELTLVWAANRLGGFESEPT